MPFHVSADTTFKPPGLHEAGRAVTEVLNHTSRSFSGPDNPLASGTERLISIAYLRMHC